LKFISAINQLVQFYVKVTLFRVWYVPSVRT